VSTSEQNKRRKVAVQPKESTGIDPEEEFFLGGAEELEGFRHVKPPRYSPAYKKMTVAEISHRVSNDIEELVARSYPTYTEEWAKKYALAWWQEWGVPDDRRCREIDEKFANSLRWGLWERLKSKNPTTVKKAYSELTELLKKHNDEEPKHAASALAFLAMQAAEWLENLSQKRAPLMQEVARKFERWPVNLGVELKVVRGKITPTVTSYDFAKDYLLQLGVNLPSRPSGNHNGPRPRNRFPFRVAASRLYQDLKMMRRDPKFKRKTPWAKNLLSLSEPMTTANRKDWWRSAKVWVDEQWERNRESFQPLIEHLKMHPAYTRSYVKKQVIDDSLKKAFKGLAIPVE
jgi:hypothetical protein